MERYCKNEKPFVYAVFSSQDRARAIPILENINESGVCFWFAEQWSKKEQRHMQAAFSVVVFLSQHSVRDEFVQKCIHYAVRYNHKILCIYLEPAGLSPGQELLLNSLQSLNPRDYADEQAFLDKLKSAEVFFEMKITNAQKKFAKWRALASVFVPIASAVLLFFTVLVPLLIAPMVQAATGGLSKVGFGNLSLAELAKVKELYVIGTQSMDQWYFAFYRDSKDRVFINDLNIFVPVGTISDISDFALLKNAKAIAIEANQVSDISPLFQIKTLEELTLNCNPIKTLDGIEALQNLKSITLVNTDIQDISPLFKIPSLERISFEYTYVRSIDGIQALKRLTDLRIGNSNLTDISALNLVDFSYSNNFVGFAFEAKNSLVKDFSPLGNIPKFSQIMLSIDRLDRILPYIRNKQVRDLNISNSDITRIQSFSSIQGMEYLELPDSQRLSSLDGIEQHGGLIEVNLKGCPNIQDFSPLFKLPKLQRLTVGSDQKALVEQQLAGATFEIVYQEN